MSIRKIFRENLPLEIYDENEGIYYKSIVQEVNDDNIAIGVPMRKQNQLLLNEGSSWTFRLTAKDSQYSFTSTVLGRKFSNRVPLYLIAWPKTVIKQQRRQFFRYSCTLELNYWVVPSGDPEVEHHLTGLPLGRKVFGSEELDREESGRVFEELTELLGEPRDAVTADISGGGLQMITPRRYVVGTNLVLCVFLRSKKDLKKAFVRGTVVWMHLPRSVKETMHRHAVAFKDTSERFNDDIVSFIFLLTRERLV